MDFYGIEKDNLDMEQLDYISTDLKLEDYDWIAYTYEMWFKLKDGINLYAYELYDGFTHASVYKLRYTKGDDVTEVEFVTDSSYAERHIKQAMQKHLDLWDKDGWFINETDLIIEQYNEICNLLQRAREYSPKEKTYKRTDKLNELQNEFQKMVNGLGDEVQVKTETYTNGASITAIV